MKTLSAAEQAKAEQLIARFEAIRARLIARFDQLVHAAWEQGKVDVTDYYNVTGHYPY